MNFPKRLLLLFLSVHAFPTDHTLCLQSPQGLRWPQVCWGQVSILKSPKAPFVGFHVTRDRTMDWALGL